MCNAMRIDAFKNVSLLLLVNVNIIHYGSEKGGGVATPGSATGKIERFNPSLHSRA